MIKQPIADGVHLLSMNTNDLVFESMWELPHGVTMNSYVVQGDKIAVIDGVIGWDGVPETLYDHLAELNLNPEHIDYVVVNHMEPDHSGWLENFKRVNDHFTLVATEKGAELVKSFYGDDIDIQVVKEGDTLDLGQGKVLSFHPVPNVHWPETMLTFEHQTGILFSCDMYGCFGTIGDHLFDDEMTDDELHLYEMEGVRYFSNVMTTFSPMVKRAIAKTEELEPVMIAPGHGPIYRSNPRRVIDSYARYVAYADGAGKDAVTILWGSMYGTTERVVKRVETMLEEAGIQVFSVHLPYDTQSEVVAATFQSAGVIVAASTYEYRMFPPVAHAIDELGRKKITGKHAFYFGSFGWNPGAERDLLSIIDHYKMKWNFVEPVAFLGEATEDDLSRIESGVKTLINNMQATILR